MRRTFVWALFLLSAAVVLGAAAQESETSGAPEVVSLLGAPLYPPDLPDDVAIDRETKLADAKIELGKRPTDVDAIIWLGRRTAYLSRYQKAIDIYTNGITHHPGNARLYRHRGHRFISTRRLDAATRDLSHAAELISGTEDEVEPDGLPNARNIPTSTLHSNIWYHLGLAHYLRGEFKAAREAYRKCMKVSTNPDMLCATTHWYYMTLMRLGAAEVATVLLEPIHAEMDIIENRDYHRLLLMYKGVLPPDSLTGGETEGISGATVGYGVANWHYYNGRVEEARLLFELILEGEQWAAFGYIAAEAEIARMRRVDKQ